MLMCKEEVEVNEILDVLSRQFNDMSVIQLKLKRHREHQTDYLYETINPKKIAVALKILVYRQRN